MTVTTVYGQAKCKHSQNRHCLFHFGNCQTEKSHLEVSLYIFIVYFEFPFFISHILNLKLEIVWKKQTKFLYEMLNKSSLHTLPVDSLQNGIDPLFARSDAHGTTFNTFHGLAGIYCSSTNCSSKGSTSDSSSSLPLSDLLFLLFFICIDAQSYFHQVSSFRS